MSLVISFVRRPSKRYRHPFAVCGQSRTSLETIKRLVRRQRYADYKTHVLLVYRLQVTRIRSISRIIEDSL